MGDRFIGIYDEEVERASRAAAKYAGLVLMKDREEAYKRAQILLAGRQLDPIDRIRAEITLASFFLGEAA